jgi:hypothetical protein
MCFHVLLLSSCLGCGPFCLPTIFLISCL